MATPLAVTRPAPDALPFFKALADETRLTILRLLALTDLKSGEIVEQLRVPQNAVSYHLKRLRALGLLRDHRSDADARDVYYSLDLDRLRALYAAAGDTLQVAGCIGATSGPGDDGDEPAEGAGRPLRVLFLCTYNSARSQLAEGIARRMGGDQVEVYSAGSEPTRVHPDAAALLAEWGIDPSAHHAKPVDEFAGQLFDYIITVCDRVRDRCPVFPGDPVQIHWSFPDPVAIADDAERRRAFRAVGRELATRAGYLLTLPHPATGRRLHAQALVAAGIVGAAS